MATTLFLVVWRGLSRYILPCAHPCHWAKAVPEGVSSTSRHLTATLLTRLKASRAMAKASYTRIITVSTVLTRMRVVLGAVLAGG